MIDQTAAAVGKRGMVPEAGHLLWTWFRDLHGTRSYHAHGPNPISYTEINAYAQLLGWPLRPEDVAAIRTIDDAWIVAQHQHQPGTPPAGKAKPITAAAFDAVWS